MGGPAAGQQLDVVAFEIGGQRYALPCIQVQELARAVRVTPLPKAPAIVEGLIDVRGALVAVLDVRARFRLPPKPLHPADYLVIARAGTRTVALRVDRVLDLLHLGPEQIEDATSAVEQVEYVAGVARLSDGLMLIHDLETFLSESEARALNEALAPEGAP